MNPSHEIFEGGGGDLRLLQQQAYTGSTWDYDLRVTRYDQKWSLERLLEEEILVVHAQMEIDFSVSEGRTVGWAYKSIANSQISTVENVTVYDGTGSVLMHKINQDNGYYFVKWWFMEPLQSEETAVVQYDIYNSVNGCTTEALETVDGQAETKNYCTESFSAPWANQWKLPVSNVTYQFLLPWYGDTPGIEYISIGMPWDADSGASSCAGSTHKTFWGDGTGIRYRQAYTLHCDELDTGRQTSPERPTFQWDLYGSDGLLQMVCRNECKSDNITMLTIAIGLGLVFTCIVFAIAAFLWRGRRRQGNTEIYDDAEVPQVMLQQCQSVLKDKQVHQLPLIEFGVTDLEGAVQEYHRTLMSNRIHNKEVSNKTDRFIQQAAYTACTSCSVCICDFDKGESVRLLPRCGHIFHHDCIRKWLVEQNSMFCPLCQATVLEEQ